MARKKKADEGSSGAYWMDTYGDMITLVLTFFVLLFSFSTIDKAKWDALVAAFAGGPVSIVLPLDPGSSVEPENLQNDDDTEQDEISPEQAELNRKFMEFYEKAVAYREENNLHSMLMVELLDDSVLLRFLDSMLFDTGRADLRPDGADVLMGLYPLFEDNMQYFKLIKIEGHTDSRPIHTFQFSDNWDLSAMRATSVIRHIINNTVIPNYMLVVGGYGEFRPIDTNDTDEGRARNRRVDIVVERREVGVEVMPTSEIQSTPETVEERTQDYWE